MDRLEVVLFKGLIDSFIHPTNNLCPCSVPATVPIVLAYLLSVKLVSSVELFLALISESFF